MKANKYQKLAIQTANNEIEPSEQLINSVLGLIGESGELCEIILICSTDNGDSLTSRCMLLAARVGYLGDQIKKIKYHGHTADKIKMMNLCREIKDLSFDLSEYATYRDHTYDLEIDPSPHKEEILDELGDCLWYIAYGVHSMFSTLTYIMKTNIEKLFKRYQGKFSYEKSINREV